MKKTFFFAYIFVAIFLLGCAKEEVITQKPAKTFPVNSQVLAMNIEIAGKPFNIEHGKDGWEGNSSRSYSFYNGVPKYLHHFNSLSKVGANTFFSIKAPLIEIADPDNINGTYTYPMLLNFFKKGKQVLRDDKHSTGYDLFLSHIVDVNNESKNFGYNTGRGNQDNGTLEIVKVEEVEFADFKRIFVTYHIDCNIYKENAARTKDRLVGTVQVCYTYEPF